MWACRALIHQKRRFAARAVQRKFDELSQKKEDFQKQIKSEIEGMQVSLGR